MFHHIYIVLLAFCGYERIGIISGEVIHFSEHIDEF